MKSEMPNLAQSPLPIAIHRKTYKNDKFLQVSIQSVFFNRFSFTSANVHSVVQRHRHRLLAPTSHSNGPKKKRALSSLEI